MSFSIVIPSRNASNLQACCAAVRKAGETARIIVVSDELPQLPASYWADYDPFLVVSGIRPFCFAVNANVGINAAGRDDVLLLNDDALLEGSWPSFSDMSMQWTEFGIISARIRGLANPVHSIFEDEPLHNSITPVERMVPFVCVFIRRALIDAIGLLDERFTGYGFEDDDYCRRTRDAGWRIGVCNGCVAEHGSLPSTFRPDGKGRSVSEMRKVYEEKWGSK